MFQALLKLNVTENAFFQVASAKLFCRVCDTMPNADWIISTYVSCSCDMVWFHMIHWYVSIFRRCIEFCYSQC